MRISNVINNSPRNFRSAQWRKNRDAALSDSYPWGFARKGLAATLCCSAIWLAPAQAQKVSAPKPFTFAAIGDLPYNQNNDHLKKFNRLIDAINRTAPAFTIHVGDIIGGWTSCRDWNYKPVKAGFDRFNEALIYTPGDNEWVDCYRVTGGHFDPKERLARIRQMFFAKPGMSLGRKPIALQIQPSVMGQQFAPYVENARFVKNNILFVTVHITGSRNNHDRSRPWTLHEFAQRDAANTLWIADAFQKAMKEKLGAIVFAWQGNVHATPRFNRNAPYSIAFANTINVIERGAKSFGKPVLNIHGDFHKFAILPFRNMQKIPVANVQKLQVYGAKRMHGVIVSVDPNSKNNLFRFSPLIIPGNGPS